MDLISPVLTLKKIKTSIINQELAQNGILMEEGERLNIIFHRISLLNSIYLKKQNKKNMLFVRLKTSLLHMTNAFLTLLVLSNEAMFVYKAFCIFLGKVHRPA